MLHWKYDVGYKEKENTPTWYFSMRGKEEDGISDEGNSNPADVKS